MLKNLKTNVERQCFTNCLIIFVHTVGTLGEMAIQSEYHIVQRPRK